MKRIRSQVILEEKKSMKQMEDNIKFNIDGTARADESARIGADPDKKNTSMFGM